MFNLLDDTLKAMLNDESLASLLPELFNADISFLTPEKPYAPGQGTVNLFLYETRENRELRNLAPTIEQRNGLSVRRRPPLRVDCAYLVTTWSDERGATKVDAEHALLAQAFNWLSRFPVIPDSYLQIANLSGQAFAPPTLVAQMDAAKNVGEFWSALGIAPRPFFNLIVTVTLDLDQALEEFPVTTVLAHHQAGNASSEEERVIIGGTVRDRARQPVRDAWVRLEPAGLTSVTDAAGHFIFDNIARGTGLLLRARAPGFDEVSLNNFDIPARSGNYDLQFN
ncbi:MAG: Pvc16 family protein [Gammaproteobacteria bacterium]